MNKFHLTTTLLFLALPAAAQGINSESTSDLPIGAGGGVAMTIKKGSEHVGINTTTPTSRLQVTGTGGYTVDFSTTGRIRTGAENSGGGTGGIWVSPSQFLGSLDSTRVGIYNNGSWAVTVQNTGAVGIGPGNSSPQSTLDVAGGVKVGTDSGACTGAKAGTLSYSGSSLLLCNGTTWKKVGGSSYQIGVTFPGKEGQIWCDYLTDCTKTIWPGETAWDEFMTVTTYSSGGYSCTHSQIWCGGCLVSPQCYVSISKN